MVRPSVYGSLFHYAQKFWHLLTAPSDMLQNPAQRRQAQFLAAVITLLMPVVLATSIYQDVSIQNGGFVFKPAFTINIVALVIGFIVYGISRTRYYQVAAYMTVLTASGAIFIAIFAARATTVQALGFLVLPILLSSILLSIRPTIVVLLLHIAALLVIAGIYPEFNWDGVLYPSIRLQLFAGIFILLGMYFRNRIEQEQNGLIRQNEQKLLQTNEELEKRVIERTLAYQIATEELIELLAERENYEREIANERNLLRTVIDNLPDHIFVLDRDGNYILVNKALSLTMVQGDAGALIGKNVLDLSPTDQAAQYFAEEKAIIETGQPKLNIDQMSLPSFGPLRYFLTSKIPLRDPNDQIVGLVGIAHDVTVRKENEKRLQDSYAEMETRVAERTAELSMTNTLLREQIADREKAETQLRYQASLLENVSDAIISVDDQLKVRSWNKAAEAMYGWLETDVVGCNVFSKTGANLSIDMIDHLMRQTRTTGSWRGETDDKRRDGTKLQVMASLSLLKDARGEVQGMVLVNRDVTERKKVEAAEHEQRLLAEALRDTSAAISSTLKLNEILESILVYVERVLPYDSASIMLLDGDVARVEHGRGFVERGIAMDSVLTLRLLIEKHANLSHMFKTGTAFIISDTSTYPEWRQGPETDWIKSNLGAPIRVEGKVIGFVNLDSSTVNHFNQADAAKLQAFADQAGIAIHNANLFSAITRHASDLETRVATRTAELVNERAQLQAIMDAMTEGVFGVLFGERPTRYANRSFQQLTGYEADEWAFDLLKPQSNDDPSDFTRDLDELYDSLTSGTVWEGRGPVRRKDGRAFAAHLILTRIDSEDGSPVGIVTILRDISQERALEQQKSLFVANASHELRTPITNMMTRLYLIRKQPEALETHLQVLDEVARRMRTLVEDLLDHSRFERGVIPLEPKLLDVRLLVRQVVNLQIPEAEKKHIELVEKQPESDLMSMVDPERMIQVITNLIMNAIHYTPEGGQVRVVVDTVVSTDGTERIRISVQDTGIGIPAALLPNLFKPFFRVSEKTKGTGLGLSIARDIVRAHDGDIVVESISGAGSRFTVDIPAAIKASA